MGFLPEHVQLVRGGRPLFVDAPRHRFAVHPCLFAATTPDLPTPQLNWENIGAEWMLPEQLKGLETVPQLDRTLERVLLSPSQQAALERLASDRQHGAAELALQAVEVLGQQAHELEAISSSMEGGSRMLDRCRNFGYQLATTRPSMPAIANAVVGVLADVHRDMHSRAGAFPPSPSEVQASVALAVRAHREVLQQRASRLREQVKGLLHDGMTVMTLSRSSTVEQGVAEAAAAGVKLKAIVCESRWVCSQRGLSPLPCGTYLARRPAAALMAPPPPCWVQTAVRGSFGGTRLGSCGHRGDRDHGSADDAFRAPGGPGAAWR